MDNFNTIESLVIGANQGGIADCFVVNGLIETRNTIIFNINDKSQKWVCPTHPFYFIPFSG